MLCRLPTRRRRRTSAPSSLQRVGSIQASPSVGSIQASPSGEVNCRLQADISSSLQRGRAAPPYLQSSMVSCPRSRRSGRPSLSLRDSPPWLAGREPPPTLRRPPPPGGEALAPQGQPRAARSRPTAPTSRCGRRRWPARLQKWIYYYGPVGAEGLDSLQAVQPTKGCGARWGKQSWRPGAGSRPA